MGQNRNEKPEDGRPICRHAKTRVWFREKKGNNAHTQTFNTPWGSSGSNCSSSKWHDPPSDGECRRFDAAVERSGCEDITRLCPNPRCESRGSVYRPASRHHERKIYLHLNLGNRESPQLVVCPERNHCQLQHSTNSRETVVDVDDSELLPRPSQPPSRSRSRLSEPALSMMSSSNNFSSRGPRSGHQSFPYPKGPVHDPSQLQSLRQAHGSGSRSSLDQVPSPTASSTITPRRIEAQLHYVGRNLQHVERAMSATPRRSEVDVRLNLAQRRHDDDGRDLNPPRSQISGVGASVAHAARNGNAGETLLSLSKWPHGQQMHVTCNFPLEKIATPRSRSTRMRNDLLLRVKGGSGSPHNEPVETEEGHVDQTAATTPPQKAEGVVLSWEGLTVTSK